MAVKKRKAKRKSLVARIRHLKPCAEACRWLAKQRTPLQAWRACKTASWMTWFVSKCLGGRAAIKASEVAWDAYPNCACNVCDPEYPAHVTCACDAIRKLYPKPPKLPRKK